jgi:branched-chain amino acid transport system substrate-binding protein
VPAVQEVVGFVTGISLFRDVLPKATGLEPDQVRAAAKAADVPLGSHINGWGMKFDEHGQNMRSFATVVQWQGQEMKVVYPEQFGVAKPIMLPLPPWDRR